MFPNQPVSFHILMAARAKVRTNAPSKELQDSLTALKVSTTITLQLTDLPLDYWIDSNNTLVDVVQQGNTRHLMHLAKLYDGVPIISMKDKVDTISLVDIAVQGNNLCSLLYVIVWDLETKGKFTRDVRERLDEYIYNAKQIVYDEMLESIIGVDDDKQIAVGAEGRLRLHAVVASAAIPNQKVNTWTPPQHLTNVRLVPVHVETIESYFSTADTPENLCDPITCSICERAVVLPISGMTISEHVALSRPRFDFFANSQFGPNQTTTPNKHLRAMVEEYISPKVHSILECLPQEEAFKEALFIMELLDGRDDLTLSAVCRNKFVTIFWKHIGTLAPQIPGLQQMEKLTLFQILTRGGIFRKEEYFALLMECDRGSKIGCGLCWLFPSVDDAYALLNVGKLLTTENTMSNAKSLLLLFIQHRRVNMLANLFAQCQAQNQQDDTNQLAPVWKVLQFMSKHCAKEDFNLLVHGLPLAVPVIDVLTSDSNLAQSVYAAEQVYKSIILEQKLQNYQAEIVALQNTIKVMGEVMENKIRKLENKNARQAEENAILLPPCGVVKGSNTVFLSEYIKVDVSKIYKFSAELASVGIDGSMDYLGFACYNEEKKEINSFDVLPAGNATVTSVLDKMVQFDGDLLNAVKNPYPCLGFYYDGDVLDRCPDDVANIVPLSATASSIELQDCLLPDVVAKIVPGKTIVRVQYCGDNYVYTAAEGAVLPCQFKKFKGTITGEGLGNARTMFRKGTAYVRIVLLANYRTPNHTVAYRDVKFMAV